jgi:hypothetical protein
VILFEVLSQISSKEYAMTATPSIDRVRTGRVLECWRDSGGFSSSFLRTLSVLPFQYPSNMEARNTRRVMTNKYGGTINSANRRGY